MENKNNERKLIENMRNNQFLSVKFETDFMELTDRELKDRTEKSKREIELFNKPIIASVTRSRDIKILLCLSAPVWKSLI